jgi:hypothetical protein
MTIRIIRLMHLGGLIASTLAMTPCQVAEAAARPAAPAGKGAEAGRYAVLRDDRDTNCMVTLHAGGKAQLAPACRDNGIVVFDPMNWRSEAGKIVLTARKGHKIELTRGDNNVWRREGETGKGLGLRPM